MKLQTDGYFCEDQIVFDRSGRSASVAKGFAIQTPSIEHASIASLNALEDEERVLLRGLRGDASYQFRFQAGGDYRQEFLDYFGETEGLEGPAASETLRNQKFTAYWHQLESGTLRRDELHLYVNIPASDRRSADYKANFASSAGVFDQYGALFEQVFQRLGGDVTPLGDDEHYADFLRYFNPSRDVREHQLNPLDSIQENCFLSEAAPVKDGSFAGFWMDGQYHGVLVLKSPPQATFSGMIGLLTGLPLLDYSITANVHSLDIATEIRQAEKACEKLQNAMRHNPKQRMQSAIESLSTRIQRLMSDEVVPFKVQIIVRAWDPSLSGLHSKLSVLESAIVKLQGATYYSPAFPPTVRNYFLASMPGWTGDKYDDHSLLLEDHNLANLLPLSGSTTGFLEKAEALYPGSNGNMIGLRTFAGEDLSPQHALVTGLTGAGKSVLLSDLLIQTEPYYSFTAIVDDGMSHARYIESVSDQPPIVIRPDGNITFSYLDTNALPLSPQHIGDAVAMIAIMTEVDHQRAPEQAAIATEALLALYNESFESWAVKNQDGLRYVARYAQLVEGVRSRDEDLTFTEAFLETRSLCPVETEAYLSAISDDQAAEYVEAHRNDRDFIRLAFAFLEPHEMPTHSDLVDWLEKQSGSSSHNAGQYGHLATMLTPWRSGGRYGALVDGVTNVSLTGSHVHIELGKIPESAKTLRSLAAFLVSNYIRNEIMNRPKHLRKRVVFEELAGFLQVCGGEQLLTEYYSRMRKYSTWVISVLQQVEMVKDSAAMASLLGNSRIGIFLKQANPAELDAISESFPLPDTTKEAILRFNDPNSEQGASFVYYHKGSKPMIATARHIILPE